jgi:hypothetical protein
MAHGGQCGTDSDDLCPRDCSDSHPSASTDESKRVCSTSGHRTDSFDKRSIDDIAFDKRGIDDLAFDEHSVDKRSIDDLAFDERSAPNKRCSCFGYGFATGTGCCSSDCSSDKHREQRQHFLCRSSNTVVVNDKGVSNDRHELLAVQSSSKRAAKDDLFNSTDSSQ